MTEIMVTPKRRRLRNPIINHFIALINGNYADSASVSQWNDLCVGDEGLNLIQSR